MAGRRKATPDLMGTMPKKRGRPRKNPEAPKVAQPTASEIAESMEKEAKRLREFAKILRHGNKA